MEVKDFIIRLAIAIVCGLIIGFERQLRHKDAGLRTNALVALGAAVFVLISIQMTEGKGDVTRIIGQIVTGIGFLGAGVIFRSGENVHGLTSAASIWCSAAVASLAATGLFWQAFVATGLVIFISGGLAPIDKWLRNRKSKNTP